MTLFQIIQILKQIALTQPNIKSATDGSIYEVMNTNPSVKYDVVHFSQTTHQSDEETDYYGLNIFYVSRLEDSLEDNRLQIQSIGKEVLDNIIRTFCENWNIDFPVITYTPFTQKFNDLCAGCYCNLRLEIPKEIICADDYVAEVVPGSGIKLQDIGITITQNGLIVITPDAEYDGIGEIRIQTEVPQSAAVLQDKEVEYTENGSYTVHPDPAYDGLSSVSVDVDVPDRYDEGYDDGKTDGENEQKAKLTVTSFTENNTYTRADGWSAVTVDVPSDYQDGYDDGEAAQKAKMVATAITENGEYGRPDGYSAITVNVPQGQGYEEGYEDGEAAQKAKLSSTSFTQNDTYTIENGWSAVTVDVPSDYQDGYNDGAADQKAKLVPTAITENGTYSREDGYSSIEVNVPQGQGYDEGFNDGEEAQKAKMVSTAFTQNGTYTREDGYSAITVNVDDRYDEGYDDGYRAGAAACSGLLATAITLNVASAITDSGTATTTYSPSTAYTDIYYTSSDSTVATIDENTGVITVLKDGTVTICTRDRMSGLQDCKSVNVIKTPPSTDGALMIKYRVTSSTEPTQVATTAISDFANYAIYGGKAYPTNSTKIQFPVTGDLWVYYILKNPTVCPGVFNGYTVPTPSSTTPVTVVEVRLPDTITEVSNYSFYGQKQLSAVTLGNSVQRIGRYAFTHCNSLDKITIPLSYTGHTYMDTVNGAVQVFAGNTKNVNVYYEGSASDWMTRIAFKGYGSNPLYQGGKLYTNSTGFSGSLINNLTIPSNITNVSDFAFDGCGSITSVTIHSGVTRLGYACFRDCDNLTGVTDNRTTPQTLATTWQGALDGTNDIVQFHKTDNPYPIYVPSASVNTYKTATGWTEYADRIQAKP